MGMTAAQYRDQLIQLLPPGVAWPRDLDTTLARVLHGLAEELARVDGRGVAIIREADPRTTFEMLTDWERVYGLPDPCVGDIQTLQERRDTLVAKIVSIGGQSPAYFVAVAASLGYDIAIQEFRPFRAGLSSAGDPLTNGDWVHTWRVYGPPVTVRYFNAGGSTAGDPLASWGYVLLECTINRLKPAHTLVQFAYVDWMALNDVSVEILDAANYLYHVANFVLPEDLN